ncbi:MAG: S8 family serine peptidase [Candidatus Poribacteria bacterium]|nr:S8 family serine peptidase [Candidatus Poribacteria bacterium]
MPSSSSADGSNLLTLEQLSDVTPGELLIRVSREGEAELKRLHERSAIRAFHSQMRVQSISRVFPYVANPTANPNLERIYLLRFSTSSNLDSLKAAYSSQPLIEAVEFNYLRQTLASEIVPNDPQFEEQWNLPLINMPRAWAIEKGSSDVIIAIVDGGIDYTHQDLATKIWRNTGEIPDNDIDDDHNGYIDDIRGWDFTDAPNVPAEGDSVVGDNDPIDESGHGTHVAGIAAADVDNRLGVAGVAWNCNLMPLRAGASNGAGTNLQDDDSAAAIVYAVDNGARIINMSWGSPRNSFLIRDAIDYAYAAGALLVAAAGNERMQDTIYPAGYRKVIAVAATEQNKQRFYQSNFGASIDVGAPGNVILSTHIGNRYRRLTGTSMAAPHVSGVAALVLSKRSNLSHDEARQIILSNVDSIVESPELVDAGNLNAAKALMASGSMQARIITTETGDGGSNTIEIFGTVGGFRFDTWQLMYGESTTPTMWTGINLPSPRQKTDERLLIWNIAEVPEGIYTVRLEAVAKNGAISRDEVVLSVDRTPPVVRGVKAREQLSVGQFVVSFSWSTDDFTADTLNYRLQKTLSPFSTVNESAVGKEHSFSLSLNPGRYDYYVRARNAAGLETIDDNRGRYYQLNVKGLPISPHGFVGESTGISPMHLGSVDADFDRDGLLEVVGLPLMDDLASGIEILERTLSGSYELKHTSTFPFKPWAIDDTDGDGLLEILGSTADSIFLIECITRTGYPERKIWESPFLSSGQIADIDGDGRKEIVGADNNNGAILIYENQGNDIFEEILSLESETDGANAFGEQVAIGDFDGDGRTELLAGDSEGELLLYEAIGDNQLTLTWQWQIDGLDAHQYAIGDLDGDGILDFVVGSRKIEKHLPSLHARWEFTLFTTMGDNRYAPMWSQEITPYRLRGNSLAVEDLDGDRRDDLVVLTYPSVHVFQQMEKTLSPTWHHEVWNTPRLLLADLDEDGFEEVFLNSRDNLLSFENVLGVNTKVIPNIQPWNLVAAPLRENLVQLTWQTPTDVSRFNVYRAINSNQEKGLLPSPPMVEFEEIAKNLDTPRFLDRRLNKNTTYWYAVSSVSEDGIESDWTTPVPVTPRTPPRVLDAEHLGENRVAITFDRPMGREIGNEKRYLLRKPDHISGVTPQSAIRGRMGKRVILSFRQDDLISDNIYEITVSEVQDTDHNPIDPRAAVVLVRILPSTNPVDFDDFTHLRVFPNPVRPSEFHKGAVTFDGLPSDTAINIYEPSGTLLERLTVGSTDRGRKEWLLLSNGTSEVASGVYIYLLEFGNLKKIGRIAVVR